jgi:hypothetical protein
VSAQFTLVAPLVVGVMVGLLGWLVLGTKREVGAKSPDKACDNCGSSVLDDWRLCPECGTLIESADEGDGPSPASSL